MVSGSKNRIIRFGPGKPYWELAAYGWVATATLQQCGFGASYLTIYYTVI